MFIFPPAAAGAGCVTAESPAPPGQGGQECFRVLMEEVPQQGIKGGIAAFQQIGRGEEVLGQHREEFVFVRIGVIADMGATGGGMGQFPRHVADPLSNRHPGDFRRQPIFAGLFLDEMRKFVDTHIVCAGLRGKPCQQARRIYLRFNYWVRCVL